MSRLKRKGEKMVKTARQLAELGGIKGDGSRKHKRKLKKYQKVTQQHSGETASAYSKLTPQEKYAIRNKAEKQRSEQSPAKMEAPLEFNAGLRKASADGKLDDNPKFKAAVDAAPVNMNYDSPAKQVIPIVDPMTGMPITPMQPANTMGTAKPVFSPKTQQVANQMFGQQMPGMYESALAKKGCKYKK